MHAVGLLDEALTEFGALSVTLTDAGDHPIFEPPPGETPLWPGTTITALFDVNVDRDFLREQIQQIVTEPGLKLQFSTLQEQDWVTLGQSGWEPMCFGNRLWVCTEADLDKLPPHATPVLIEPGLAFGTGSHPTTALCLQWLDQHIQPGQVVIDYGCGSGILGLAAAKLGAASVIATDIDSQALDATNENAKRNQCANLIQAQTIDEYRDSSDKKQADLLLANILAGPLISLADPLSQKVKPGGGILLSGILAVQQQSVVDAYEPYFSEIQIAQQDDWIRLSGTRIAQV